MLNHGSLFSGIGGFDLASEWMGWENVFHCEWNEFGQKILKYYWPNAISYGDITKTDFTIHRGKIDIITGGFPCQPYSLAGKRKGKEDERHLWPEMLRAIREIRPCWVVGENVPGIINWSEGLVFHEVQTDLEAEGYEVFPVVLPACGVNAPHKRERIWFVAYNKSKGWGKGIGQETNSKEREMAEFGQKRNSIRNDIRTSDKTGNRIASNPDSNGHELRRLGENRSEKVEGISEQEQRERIWPDNRRNGEPGITPDTRLQRQEVSKKQTTGIEQCDEGINCNSESKGLERENGIGMEESNQSAESVIANTDSSIGRKRGMHKTEPQETERHFSTRNARDYERQTWNNFPTQSPLCSRDDGISTRLDGITFPKWRNESIKAYGNAIVPQVALQIFKAIEEFVLNENKV